jgi:Cys-tRNA synthase (O-phospho-L-seryl-tRNA:Cys-tRNA synthase)
VNESKKSLQIQKTYEALFALEDIREIFRQSLPAGFDEKEQEEFSNTITRVKSIISDLEKGEGNPACIRVGKLEPRTREEEFINIHPIQAAGRLTPEARKAIISYGDGYSTCDYCRKPFRLDKITRPPIEEFHQDLAKFLNMDQARVVPGARRGFQAVTQSIVQKGDSVVVSSLAHYTEFLAVEVAGGIVKEVPLDENHIVTADSTALKIEDVKRETGKLPALIMIDHFDYQFANEVRKSNYLLEQFLCVRDSKVLSEWPRRHTLTKVDTTGSFDVIAKTHKRRGFFFSDELKERGVIGEFAGATRTWKLNTYGLTWDQIKYTSDTFLDIASKYGLDISKLNQFSVN